MYETLGRCPGFISDEHDAHELRESIHDRPLDITERTLRRSPESDDAHADARIRQGWAGRHRHQPADPDVIAEHFGRRTLARRVSSLDRLAGEHRPAVQHTVVERPFTPDQRLRPGPGGGDDAKDVGSAGGNERDDALRLGHDPRALNGHRAQDVLEPLGGLLPRRGLVDEPRDDATDRLMDPADLVTRQPACFGARRFRGGALQPRVADDRHYESNPKVTILGDSDYITRPPRGPKSA